MVSILSQVIIVSYMHRDKLAPRFAASHTVITLCLPDLDKRQLARYWGYSFETLVDMLDATLRQLVPRGHPIVLVAHDWGAFVATKYLGREDKSTQVEKYVCLDVGIGLSGGVSGILAAGCYQMYLAGAFLLGRILPTVAGDLMMYVYPWKLIGPCPHDIETGLSNTRTSYTDGLGDGVHCWMNYPYFHMVLNPTAALKLPFPKVPTLYVYGNKKRSMFHDRQFLRRCVCACVCLVDSTRHDLIGSVGWLQARESEG